MPGSASLVRALGGRAFLLVLLATAFLVSAAAFLLPGVAGPLQRATVNPAPAGVPAPVLTAQERTQVLSYAGGLQPDDALVEVRPGVQAKRSNVEGVRLDGRTVYYDLLGHQSFGPLGRGRVREQDVVVLARDGAAPFQVVIYALK